MDIAAARVLTRLQAVWTAAARAVVDRFAVRVGGGHCRAPGPGGPGGRRVDGCCRPREERIAIPCLTIIADAVFNAAQNVSRDNSTWSPRRLPEDVEAWLLCRLVHRGACRAAVGCKNSDRNRESSPLLLVRQPRPHSSRR